MNLVAVVGPEQYLFGLGEVPSSWPMAAMEAQAVAGRTYAFEKISRLGQHQAGCRCGVYASTADQVYAGWDKEAEPGGARWRAAVQSTAGRVVTYRGSLIEAFYSSSSGGHTQSNQDAWGGSPIPYLRSVCDPGDFTPANPNRAWTVTLTPTQVGGLISRATGTRLGAGERFVDTARTAGGRISATTFVGTRGRVRITGGTLASALGLPSPLVWIDSNRNVLPPLRGRYDSLGCGPGFATSPQIRIRGGLVQRFPSSALYLNAHRAGTYWLHGAVYEKYRQRGDWSGPLGLPRSGVRRKGSAVMAFFEHGVVSCTSGGCRVRRR
jgi:SpoIID/LytB domain protein